MKTKTDPFLKYLESELFDLLSSLKPEIKNKFVYQLNEDAESLSEALAETHHLLKPPLVIFYLNRLNKLWKGVIRENLKNLISHEVIHCIEHLPEEETAYGYQNKVNFFEDK